jgi:transcriptional regulator with XRE-family HTH domain
MDFATLQSRLLVHIRERVRSGEMTERGLARLTGVSQPHLHHVLKGVRLLSVDMADQILERLNMDLLDLLHEGDVELRAPPRLPAYGVVREVPLWEGRIGPGHPFPREDNRPSHYPFLAAEIATLAHPVAARLAEDRLMQDLFRADDVVLLDRAESWREQPRAESYYVVEWGGGGMIRHVRREANGLHLFAGGDASDAWGYISLSDRNILEIVRARVFWIGRYLEPSPLATRPTQEAGQED